MSDENFDWTASDGQEPSYSAPGSQQDQLPGDDASLGGYDPNSMTPKQVDLLKKLVKEIKADKAKWDAKDGPFKRMKRDMRIARTGRDIDWSETKYTANIVGNHIRQKTSALYAKNPQVVAKRRETLDFQIWNEDQGSLMMAMQTLQQAVLAGQSAQGMESRAQPAIDEATGAPLPAPQLPPGFEQAQALIADFQSGMQRREAVKKIGKTLEVLYAQAVREQTPLNFKSAMKRVVRRALTTGVGYVEVGFQRATGPRNGMYEQLADAQARLARLQALVADIQDDAKESDPDIDEEQAELENMIQALQAEPETVLREGLVFDYPLSTRVIPDRRTKSLVGFVGANHLTLEYLYTKAEIRAIFGVEVEKFNEYLPDGQRSSAGDAQPSLFDSEDRGGRNDDDALALVWKYYDKPSGLVYFLVDGCEHWLREPAPPDVYVDDFWPVYALTFNDVESEDDLFPPSDVQLITDIQKEYNRSREGKRQHRKFAIPRHIFINGVLDKEDLTNLQDLKPFEAVGLNTPPETDLSKVIVPVPVPGVDPNLYDVGEIMADLSYVVGAQQAQLGATSKATATESTIAANSASMADASSMDDLDEFLTRVARGSGQILMREMSEDMVMKVVGPGAFWPQQTLQDIADDIWLEVQAGSTGKPNSAVEINNWKQMLPFLVQMPGIDPVWLARETLRRLDDRMDLTEAIISGVPSLVAQNRGPAGPSAPPAPQGPGANGGAPEAQGAHGAQNAPVAPHQREGGSGAAFGDNKGAVVG